LHGYLIDTQIVSYWFNKSRPEHANVSAHVAALPAGTPLRVSVITVGEIAFGHASTSQPNLQKQAEFNQFIRDHFPEPLEVSRFTPPFYGELRALIFKKFPPQGKKQRRPEQCFDPVTATELGIDENDLWIVSQAYEHNLVLATHDKMKKIRGLVSPQVAFEDWTEPI
jgi:predicted nucleic acid-binding protein